MLEGLIDQYSVSSADNVLAFLRLRDAQESWTRSREWHLESWADVLKYRALDYAARLVALEQRDYSFSENRYVKGFEYAEVSGS